MRVAVYRGTTAVDVSPFLNVHHFSLHGHIYFHVWDIYNITKRSYRWVSAVTLRQQQGSLLRVGGGGRVRAEGISRPAYYLRRCYAVGRADHVGADHPPSGRHLGASIDPAHRVLHHPDHLGCTPRPHVYDYNSS